MDNNKTAFDIRVTLGLLNQSYIIHHVSLFFSIAGTALLIFYLNSSLWSLAFLSVIILLVVQTFFRIRIEFDCELLKASLAVVGEVEKDSYFCELDSSLTRLGLVKDTPVQRAFLARAKGCFSLLKLQCYVVGAQCAVLIGTTLILSGVF